MGAWACIRDNYFGGRDDIRTNIIVSSDSAAVAGKKGTILLIVSTTSAYLCKTASDTAATWLAI